MSRRLREPFELGSRVGAGLGLQRRTPDQRDARISQSSVHVGHELMTLCRCTRAAKAGRCQLRCEASFVASEVHCDLPCWQRLDDLTQSAPAAAGSARQYDEKNIRRRVYDALNVLMAMDIITRQKKDIVWRGLPHNQVSQPVLWPLLPGLFAEVTECSPQQRP